MHMAQLADELGLTPEQRQKLEKKLEADKKAMEAKMKQRMGEMQKHMKAVEDAFATETFDAKKVGVGTHRVTMVKEMADNRVHFVETVLGILTPEQRTKFADHVRAHAGPGMGMGMGPK